MRRLVTAIALSALIGGITSPSFAQRDCCFYRSTPMILHGATLGAGTIGEALARSERLGFLAVADATGEHGGMPAIPLHEGRLEWSLETFGPFGGLGTRVLLPTLRPIVYPICGGDRPPPLRPQGGDPTIGHANHARRVVGVIGIVADVEVARVNVGHNPPFTERNVVIPFGRPYPIEDLDALAVDGRVPTGGFVRLIAPRGPHSRCAELAGSRFDRWIGLVIGSDDIEATAAWFAAHDVPFGRARGGVTLDPETTGGVYIEFVVEGARPVL